MVQARSVSAHVWLSLTLLFGALCAGCREGSGAAAGTSEPIPLSVWGASGCSPAGAGLGQLAAVTLAQLDIGPQSQLAASRDTLGTSGTYELYVTGEGATLVKLVFDPAMPEVPVMESVLLAPGDVDALPEYAGIAAPAALSGLTVLDPSFLLVVETSANTLLLVRRDVPGSVAVLPGLVPDEAAGNADGTAGLIRFSFSTASGLLGSGDGRIFLADPGNDSIRLLLPGGLVQSFTIAGQGAPAFADGALPDSAFDTPVGLALTCSGELVVAETGAAASGGHRLRRLRVGDFSFFAGGFAGDATTIVGDGTPLTTGGSGGGATVAGPMAPVTTAAGLIYWVDSLTGVLRRYDPSTDVADCPLFADCASATAALGIAPNFASMGGVFALAITEDQSLYALDADAEALWRVAP